MPEPPMLKSEPTPSERSAGRSAFSVLVLHQGDVGRRTCELLAEEVPEATVDAVIVGDDVTLDIDRWDALGLVTGRPVPALEESLDALCWEAGVPWTRATLVADAWRVGPSVVPGATPCFECWTRRRRSMVGDLEGWHVVDQVGRRTAGPWFRGELGILNEQVAALAAAELVALATGTWAQPEGRRGRFWQGGLVVGAPHPVEFAAIGRCRRCGPMPSTGDDPLPALERWGLASADPAVEENA